MLGPGVGVGTYFFADPEAMISSVVPKMGSRLGVGIASWVHTSSFAPHAVSVLRVRALDTTRLHELFRNIIAGDRSLGGPWKQPALSQSIDLPRSKKPGLLANIQLHWEFVCELRCNSF